MSSTWQKSCNLRPLVAHLLVSLDKLRLLFGCPSVFLDVRAQVMVPALRNESVATQLQLPLAGDVDRKQQRNKHGF